MSKPSKKDKRTGTKKKGWTVELTAQGVPCPPHQEPVYWAAWKNILKIAKQAEKTNEREK